MISPTYCRSFTVPAALLLLSALPALAQAGADSTTPQQGFNYYAAGLRFPESQYVDSAKYGLVGDGRTDNTAAFRALLGHGGRAVHVKAGTYVTGALDIPGNTTLLLDPDVIIKDSGKLIPSAKLITISHNNVYIRAQGAQVLSDPRFYHGGEYRHGVFIVGATDVVIDGLQSNGNSGDGFYIGSDHSGKPALNVTLENCSALHNRRNGLSITAGVRINVLHCTFSYTRGTAPQYGIDIEPSAPRDPITSIKIVDVRTVANAGGGISIYLGSMYRPQKPISIDIVNHQSSQEYHRYQTVGVDRVRGTIVYNGKRTTRP
jgi:hypothetical protein